MSNKEWCAQNGISVPHFAAVTMIFNRMSSAERFAQYNAMTAGWSGSQAVGWDKVKHMYNGGWRPDEVKIWGRLLQTCQDETRNVAGQPSTWDDGEYGSES